MQLEIQLIIYEVMVAAAIEYRLQSILVIASCMLDNGTTMQRIEVILNAASGSTGPKETASRALDLGILHPSLKNSIANYIDPA